MKGFMDFHGFKGFKHFGGFKDFNDFKDFRGFEDFKDSARTSEWGLPWPRWSCCWVPDRSYGSLVGKVT